MLDPEKHQSPPPLFRETLRPGAPMAQTVGDPDTPRVTSAGCSFLPTIGQWYTPPAPSPDRLIVGSAKHKKLVMELQKKFSNQLGFLPGVAIDFYLENGHTGIALENGEPCGYVLGRPSFRFNRQIRPITQAAVFMDAQRRHHGLALIAATCRRAAEAGQLAVQATCRADIDAVDFWSAAGFMPIATVAPETARRKELIVFRRCLVEPAPPWFLIPPNTGGFRNRRRDEPPVK
jgi:hypothetical protein